jgi:hypothetical protein
MLIFILSSLLWQPDYTPRVEIGLPQINLDAPRLLAHCFLYDLDAFLASDPNRDFVRFMDDIDIGVDDIPAAKQVLRSVDLVLQTKQIRLNTGKTQILSRQEAFRYFRVVENARLDLLFNRIRKKRKLGLGLNRERRLVELRIHRGLANKVFDHGYGEKILKRFITAAAMLDAKIQRNSLLRIILLRPAVRENIYAFIRTSDLTVMRSDVLATAAESNYLVDDAGIVDLVNHLVETNVRTTSDRHVNIIRIIEACDPETYFGLYCRLWLQSKYDSPTALLNTIASNTKVWVPNERLGRTIGAFRPLFYNTADQAAHIDLVNQSRNDGVRDTYKFHMRLSSEPQVFDSMYEALRNPNPSRGTGITHAKFLCLISALLNQAAPLAGRQTLKTNNSAAWRDIYYRGIAKRLRI